MVDHGEYWYVCWRDREKNVCVGACCRCRFDSLLYVCEKELFSDVNLLNLTLPPLATATMMIAAISTSSSRG